MSRPNESEKDRSLERFSDQIHLRQPTEAQTDSDGESGISISSQQSMISISSQQTQTDNATPQQTRGGIVFFLSIFKYEYTLRKVNTILGEGKMFICPR